MRAVVAVAMLALAGCVTPPMSPEEQAAHFGAIPEPPTHEQLSATDVVTDVVWISRPDGTDYVTVWPRDAWYAEAEAMVGLDCLVQNDGTVACVADDDGWPQYDFEHAALMLSTQFRLDSQSRSGVPVAGKRIKINIAFQFMD